MSLAIKCYPKGVYGENTYLIEDEATGYKAIIDPGYYDMEVRMDIANNIYLKYVLLTHGHHDHYFAANKYLQEYGLVSIIEQWLNHLHHYFPSHIRLIFVLGVLLQ